MTLPQTSEPVAFTFGKYSVRPMHAGDADLIRSFIANDPAHANSVKPEFFLHNVPGEDSWAVEDEYKRLIFYFKTQVACRVHIQFGPSESTEDRERNREALSEGMAWLESRLSTNNFREILFDSTNTPLILYATRRLGFEHVPGELRRSIPLPPPMKTPRIDRHPQPMPGKGI